MSACFRASILFPFSQPPLLPCLLSLLTPVFLSPLLNPRVMCLYLRPLFSLCWFDFPHSQLFRKTGRSASPPPPPPPLCQFDNRLSQVLNVSSESAPWGPWCCRWAAGKWQSHLRASRGAHVWGGGGGWGRVFHLAFDWALIVICGAHCSLVKGSGSNRWGDWRSHKRRETASWGRCAGFIRFTRFKSDLKYHHLSCFILWRRCRQGLTCLTEEAPYSSLQTVLWGLYEKWVFFILHVLRLG